MTKILHNETCPICAREVRAYSRLADKAGVTLTVDGLDDAGAWGVSRDEAARVFRLEEGGVRYEGMDAFRVLWAKLPYWRHLATITGLPVVRQITDVLYRTVAAPLLYGLHRRRQRKASA
ncbi:MAG: DUF393 domain-containing protein [Pseudomonadota bacterium]